MERVERVSRGVAELRQRYEAAPAATKASRPPRGACPYGPGCLLIPLDRDHVLAWSHIAPPARAVTDAPLPPPPKQYVAARIIPVKQARLPLISRLFTERPLQPLGANQKPAVVVGTASAAIPTPQAKRVEVPCRVHLWSLLSIASVAPCDETKTCCGTESSPSCASDNC